MALIVFIILCLVYFFPYMWALHQKHKNATGIFVLNFFLGWTFVGWVVALIWADHI